MDVYGLRKLLEVEGIRSEIYQDSGPPVRLLARILGKNPGRADPIVGKYGAGWVSDAQDEDSIAALGYPHRVG